MANKNNDLQEIEKHHRVNNILLGPLERPALEWLAKHMPMWVTPDLLTTLGLLSAVLISASYYLSSFNRNYLWLANLGLFLNWFGDSLDGNLARYRHIERPHYGFFIDHTVDTISEVLVFIGIGLSPYVDLKLALLALVGYQCMANLVYITTSVKGEFKISYASLGPTEVRAIGIIVNAVIFIIGNPEINLPWRSTPVLLYNLIVSIVVCILFLIFLITMATTAAKLEKEDRQELIRKQAEAHANEAHEKKVKNGPAEVSLEK